jgi:hypothetical protein
MRLQTSLKRILRTSETPRNKSKVFKAMRKTINHHHMLQSRILTRLKNHREREMRSKTRRIIKSRLSFYRAKEISKMK